MQKERGKRGKEWESKGEEDGERIMGKAEEWQGEIPERI